MYKKLLLLTASLVLSVNFIAAGTARAATAPTFPIAELGSCQNKDVCETYCNNPANIPACVAYAEAHGMIDAEDAARAREFADVLRGEGPGGCKKEAECKNYCADFSTHGPECIAFAEKHNLMPPKELNEARKIIAALSGGKKLPGGCKDKDGCDQYCNAPGHASECLAFAEAAGMMEPEELAEAKKVIGFVERGETPGGCKTKQECRVYCDKDAHFEECINFAEKAGLVDPEEAAMARKSGGQGPGGCKGKEACEAYCNKPENSEACFNFAKEKGIIPPEKLKQIEDGMGRLRTGLKQMPPEMVQCIKSELGDDVISKIEAGTLVPGPGIGDKIQECAKEHMGKIREQVNELVKEASPEVKACLEKEMGEDGMQKFQSGDAPDPEQGDKMKKCFEGMKQEGLQKLREGLGKMPAEMRACIESKLGAEKLAKIQAGEDVDMDANSGKLIQECVGQAKAGMQGKLNGGLGQVPSGMRSCFEGKLIDYGLKEKIDKGEGIDPETMRKLIQECAANFNQKMPEPGSGGGIPPGGPVFEKPEGVNPPAEGAVQTIPPVGTEPDANMCAQFKVVPSCDMVPEAVRALCQKCR